MIQQERLFRQRSVRFSVAALAHPLMPFVVHGEEEDWLCHLLCVCFESLCFRLRGTKLVCLRGTKLMCLSRDMFFAVCRGRWCPGQELQSDGGTEEDLGGEPLTWTESLGSGGPLFYSSLLRWQASALQVGTGFACV